MKTPDLLAMVGTHHCPFDRFVTWVDAFAAAHPELHVIIQYGTSTPPRFATGVETVDRATLTRWGAQARVRICHGGPSIMMEWLRSGPGTPPLVIARDPRLGEHIDDHQLRFTRFAAAQGWVIPINSGATLERHATELIADPRPGAGVDLPPPPVAASRLGEIARQLTTHRPQRRN